MPNDDKCPRCGGPLEYDEADIGVGVQRWNPGCPECYWTPQTPQAAAFVEIAGYDPPTPDDPIPPGHLLCGRCYDEVPIATLREANCRPTLGHDVPIGQYHCPDCGGTVIAGIPHPKLCVRCYTRTHPGFDRMGGWSVQTRETT